MHGRIDMFHLQSDARVALPDCAFEDRLTAALATVGVPRHIEAGKWDWLWGSGIDEHELYRRAYGDG